MLPKYAGLSTPRVASSRLRDSRAHGIEKAPIFARPTLSRLPHILETPNFGPYLQGPLVGRPIGT